MLTMTKLLPDIRSTLFCSANPDCSRLPHAASHRSQFVFTTSTLCGSVPAPRADSNISRNLEPQSGSAPITIPGRNVVHPRSLGKQRFCLPISMKGSRLGEQHRL